MKRFILPLLAALALPTAGYAGVDPEVHNLCKDVSDYMGCVKANSKKEISIFDGLSKKETEFLKDHINSPRRVSTSNGKWILQGISERSGDEIYLDTNSIKKVGRLVSIKRCILHRSSNKKLCDNPTNNFPGGTSLRLFDCKKRLHFKSFRPEAWKSIDKSKFNLETIKIACNY